MRTLFLSKLFAAATAVTLFTLFAGCTADLTEGCLSGKCLPSTTASASSSTGAGGGDGGIKCGPLPATGDIPCDVFKVIHSRCNPCHVDPPKVGAPFPLLTYEDTQMPFDTHGKLRYARMKEVIQPDGFPHMPYKSSFIVVPELTAAEFKTLDDWLACPMPTAEGQGCECPGMGCDALPP
ncbi:MAG: hypothetical protein ABJE95_02960 [Byssovorax sp.]